MTWRVATSLETLLGEVNAAAPNRSKVSDGSIGDAAHASRDSDHNPFVIDSNGVGVVRARDFTNDPTGGLDCNDFAPRIAALMRDHPACGSGAYVIWNRRIWSADRDTEGWRTYTGSNPHDHHCHVSVALAAAGYDSTAPWGVMTSENDMNSAQDERLKAIETKVDVIGAALAKFVKDEGDRAAAEKQRDRASWKRDLKIIKEMVEHGADLDELVAYVDKHGQPS